MLPRMPDPIEIVAYDAAWPGWFAQVGAGLRDALGDTAVRIDHVGSTAVPGLDAKPVLDIQISVVALEPSDPYAVPLERLGYVFHADNPERTKRYFREPPGTARTHLHVRRAGSFSQQLPLLFRDFLRADPDTAKQYAELKRSLATTFRDDRAGYTDAKSDFIWAVIRKADDWAQDVGWEAGPSDA